MSSGLSKEHSFFLFEAHIGVSLFDVNFKLMHFEELLETRIDLRSVIWFRVWLKVVFLELSEVL